MTFPAVLQPRHVAWLLLALIVIWFGNLEYRKLIKPDEGRYAEIPREMVVSGNWVTPRLNGIKYFEKPPLQYWATAVAYEVFGQHQWTARLWPALTGLLGIFGAWLAGLLLFGPLAGFYAAAVLGSSLIYVFIAHINTLDMGVSFFMGAVLWAFLLAQRDDAPPAATRLWMHVAWAAMALAMLSKGLIGIALPGAVLVLYSLIERDWALWKRLHLTTGLILFVVITAPWFVLVQLKNPEFSQFFFVHEHFKRFLTPVAHRTQPWWYFFPILFAGLVPWLITFFDALPRAWRGDASAARFRPLRLCLIWAVFIYVFFTLSDSKLPSYILPIWPALALIIGWRLSRISGRALSWHAAVFVVIGIALMVTAPLAPRFASTHVPRALFVDYVPWLLAAGAVLAAGSAIACILSRHQHFTAAVTVFAFGGLLFTQLLLTGHNSFAPTSSTYAIAQKIKPYLRPGAPFYSVGTYYQTLDFYIKRTVTVVAFRDELSFGLDQEPQLGIPDYATFERLWRKTPYALAIMTPETYGKMEQARLPMQVIAHDTRRVVVRTPPSAGKEGDATQ
jgi:4-amino-4-deoxy-L-arabinose transferase-like glycosyltransferase